MVHGLRSLLSISDDLPFFATDFVERRWPRFVIRGAFAAVLLVAAYIPALAGNLLWVDDTQAASESLLRSTSGLAYLWRHPLSQSGYQPLADTFLWVQYQLWAAHPQGYHGVSLLLHGTNCLIAWLILRRLNVPGAWLIALVFGLHPLQVQAVAWVGGQPILFATLLYGLALLLYLRFAGVEPIFELDPTIRFSTEWYATSTHEALLPPAPGLASRASYAASLLLFVLSLLADFTCASLPWVILIVLGWRLGRITRRNVKHLRLFLAVSVLAYAFEFWRAETYARHHDIASTLSFLGRILVAGRALAFYVTHIVWPVSLSFAPRQWEVDTQSAWQYFFPALMLAAMLMLWSQRRRIGKGIGVGLAFFIANLLPVLGLFRHGWMRYSFVGSHLGYRAAIGLFALLIAGLMAWITHAPSKNAQRLFRLVTGVALLPLLVLLTAMQSAAYATDESLWQSALSADHTSTLAHKRLASLYLKDGKPQRAVEHIQAALTDDPNNLSLALQLGQVFESQSRLHDAMSQYLWAIHLDPQNAEAYVRAASITAREGDTSEAINYYLHALRLDPNDVIAHNGIGQLYADGGRTEEAMSHFRDALRIDPNSPARACAARLLFRRRQLAEAAEQLQPAAQNRSQ